MKKPGVQPGSLLPQILADYWPGFGLLGPGADWLLVELELFAIGALVLAPPLEPEPWAAVPLASEPPLPLLSLALPPSVVPC